MSDPNENKTGYKETKVGWIPEEWECVQLGEVFSHSRDKGKDGLHTYSVTVDRGLVPRAELDRKMAPDLPADESLLVSSGDVAYNMMRMWQGSVAVASAPCVVSPAYVVCRPAENASSAFMLRYFKSHLGLYQLWAYSYGITNDRLRLYFADFRLVPAPLPPLPEQEKIASILSDCDTMIEKVDSLIEAKRLQKRALMQQLLSGEKRIDGFDAHWETHRLGELFTERKETNATSLPLLAVTGKRGIIPASQIDRKDSSSADKSRYRVIYPGDIGYNTMRMWQGVSAVSKLKGIVSPAYTICTPIKDVDAVFMGYFFKFPPTVNLFWRFSQGLVDDTLNLKFPNFATIRVTIPSKDEQVAIAKVLQATDAGIGKLEDRKSALKALRRSLTQQLLTGQVRVKV